MSCYHPLKAFKIGINEDTGKDKYIIRSYQVDYIYKRVSDDHWIDGYGTRSFIPNYIHVDEWIEIPCGKCIGCRLKYSREWANRCMMESYDHEHNWFLTLTYNDNHLPSKRKYYDGDGNEKESPFHPLVKRDLQLFFKRLRNHSGQKFRYFAAGEYGSKSGRPHYHVIIFGLKLDDIKPISKNPLGQQYYTSDTITRSWLDVNGNEIGFHILGAVDWNSCAYVARYVTKKIKSKDHSIYDMLNYEPEFSLMSRKPGIARNYYENHKEEIYRNQEIFLSTNDGCKRIRPPHYFDNLYDIDYPSDMASIKDDRKRALEVMRKLKGNLTSLQYLDTLEVSERIVLQKTKILEERNLRE